MSLEINYQSLKTANIVRESEDLRVENRRRNLLILILAHLSEQGYLNTAAALEKETNISLNKWQVCDNIDLDNILQEYESYYFIKFQKQVKITRKIQLEKNEPKFKPSRIKRSSTTLGSSDQSAINLPQISASSNPVSSGRRRPSSGVVDGKKRYSKPPLHPVESSEMKASDLGLTVSSVKGKDEKKQKIRKEIIDMRSILNDAINGATSDVINNQHSSNHDKLVKPLGGYAGLNHELRELANVISRDIYLHDPDVRWDDIIGLDHAKSLVKEAVVYPIKYPQLFSGILTPWKGILLYGPPGTGKTLLAKAVATECRTTFFNISASTIVSKWRGDSEKLVRVLFELARFHAPSTIFLDELESVMSQRGSGPGGEHEGSRRMKTELLVQMDGLSKSDDLVFVLAASNLPWELDQAMLRRLEKRILVDLPITEARQSMFERFLPSNNSEGGVVIKTSLDYKILADQTGGYSGSDLKLVSKEAAMRVLRKIFMILEHHQNEDELPEFSLDTITTKDVLDVLNHTKPSIDVGSRRYEDWRSKYESL